MPTIGDKFTRENTFFTKFSNGAKNGAKIAMDGIAN
jgi:hypothetical protein